MEKFALLNLLKALQSLSQQNQSQPAAQTAPAEKQPEPATPPPPPENVYPNVMASVLERHEEISNRLKNKR